MGPWRELISARRWRPAPAMAILGVAGGLLYASAGEWTYLAVLSDRTAALVATGGERVEMRMLIAAASLLAGGMLAAQLSGRFAWQRPDVADLLRTLVGGVLMSGSAALLPGGNDVLLLYGVPSLVPYAIVGYLVIIITISAIFWLVRETQRKHT